MSHASKIALKILTRRLGKDQFSFRKDRDTRDAIVALHVLYERNLEYNNKVYVCYVDCEKAFDHVNWTKLMTILQNTGNSFGT